MWHLSKSNPCKVYDERHQVAALATSPEYAARIVAAVTGKAQEVIRLREPVDRMGQTDQYAYPTRTGVNALSISDLEAATSHFSNTNEGPKSVLNSFEPDDCCGKHISKASRAGVLEAVTTWTCERCGTDWKPTTMGNIRHWKPESDIAILRR
jgi:hypothetical protein